MLLLVIAGIIDFGRAFFTQIELTNAAREGARAAVVSTATRGRVEARAAGVRARSRLASTAATTSARLGGWNASVTAQAPFDVDPAGPGDEPVRRRRTLANEPDVHGGDEVRRLTSRRFGTRARDRGAAAVLVTVLLAGGVVMGMLALSVDVGQHHARAPPAPERRRRHVAGARAVCAKGQPSCDDTVTEQASLERSPASMPEVTATPSSCGLEPTRPQGVCGRGDRSAADLRLRVDERRDHRLDGCPPIPTWLSGAERLSDPLRRDLHADQGLRWGSILPKYFSQALAGGGTDTSVSVVRSGRMGTRRQHGDTIPLTMSALRVEAARRTAGP